MRNENYFLARYIKDVVGPIKNKQVARIKLSGSGRNCVDIQYMESFFGLDVVLCSGTNWYTQR